MVVSISDVISLFSIFQKRKSIRFRVNPDTAIALEGPRSFWFPCSSPDELTFLENADDYIYSQPASWVAKNNGIEVGKTCRRVVIQANNTSAIVRVLAIRTHLVSIDEGILVVPPPSGGALFPYSLRIDLDTGDYNFLDANRPDRPIKTDLFTVSDTEPLVFNIFASAQRGSYKWSIDFEISEKNGRKKVISLPASHENLKTYSTVGSREVESTPAFGRRSYGYFPAYEWSSHFL